MPRCLDCVKLKNDRCFAHAEAQEILARQLPPPPVGACMIPIVEDYLTLIKKDMKILDIGCGTWELLRNHCESIGAIYEGIDTRTESYGKKTVATRIENLAELSFPDNFFDLVIGNQTMEHWAEYSCTLKWGLYQCFRVCKQQGMVMMNVPIYYHGTSTFLLGEIEKIKELYSSFSSQVTFCPWGNPCDPLTPFIPYPDYSKLSDKPSYILDIRAVKDCSLPQNINNKGAKSGFLAQLFNMPFSFSVYRVFRKLGFAL